MNDTLGKSERVDKNSESKTSSRRLKPSERQAAAMELKLAGKSYRTIARKLDFRGPSGAHKAVAAYLRKTLTAPSEELRKIASRLGEEAGICAVCVSLGEEELSECALAACRGTGEIQRGPGTVPLVYSSIESMLKPTVEGAISNDDMTRASLGDTLDVVNRQGGHEAEDYTGTQEGKTLKNYGQGGDAVWKNQLTPQERNALSKFYK